MNYTEKDLDKIDDELSRPARNDDPPKFSQSISSDPELKAAAEDVELVWQATRLERLQGKLEMLKEYALRQAQGPALRQAQGPDLPSPITHHPSSIDLRKAKEFQKGRVVRMTSMRWVLSAAAGVLLLVAVEWFLFRDQGPQEIKHEYLAMHFEDQYVQHDVVRSANISKYSAEQLKAYNLYTAKQFKAAVPLLKELWKTQSDSLAAFYLGVSYVAIGKEDRANTYFDQVIHDLTYQALIHQLEINHE